MKPIPVLALCLAALCGCDAEEQRTAAERIERLRAAAPAAQREWRAYLGNPASDQYSPLTQIAPHNVGRLAEAWRYDPGDAGEYDTLIPTNPLVVGGVLYGLSARKNLFALDAASGEELWVHEFDRPHLGKGAGRGLVYWEGSLPDGERAAWVIVGLGADLYAVDALTGEPARAFGDGGRVDLRPGLDRPVDEVQLSVIAPGTLYGDLLIQGFGTGEFYGAAPGYIRAFHIPSGRIRWTFRSIPAAGEYGADSWPEASRAQMGGANSWAGIAVDGERGIAFVPTGSAAYDFYGEDRAGDNLFANSLIALNAATGERLWHYQVVRHDLWDRDLPAPPNLVELRRGGERVAAVSQATKSGHLFVFDRETGEPLFPLREVPASGAGMPGEHPARSQPLPSGPPPFARQRFEITDIDAASTAHVRELIAGMTVNSPFHAPDAAGLVLYPGFDGGAEWGGQAWDADTGLLYVNTTEVASHFSMVPRSGPPEDIFSAEFGYLMFCGGCHGADRAGSGESFPSLRDIGDRYWPWEVWSIVREGRGRMPAMRDLPWQYLLAVVGYLYTAGDSVADSGTAATVTGYIADGFHDVRDQHDLPGSKPPWGSLVAIDLQRGDIAWKVPLGDYPQARSLGLSGLGAANYGGPVVTAGGLVFIAATPDSRIRAFDKASGEELWAAELPAAGFATPAVYEARGRQFVVIAAGGGKLGQRSGSAYVAFALPDAAAAGP